MSDEARLMVAISGSRTFTEREMVDFQVDQLVQRDRIILVGDASRGVDRMVSDRIHYLHGANGELPRHRIYVADWETQGKRAGVFRNARMLADADALVAFLADGPETPGTANAIQQAIRAGMTVTVFHERKWSIRNHGDVIPADLEYVA